MDVSVRPINVTAHFIQPRVPLLAYTSFVSCKKILRSGDGAIWSKGLMEWMDFKVTRVTVLYERHFTAAHIKRNPKYWHLVCGAEPSQNLFQSSVTTSKQKARKPPVSHLKLMPSVYVKPGVVSYDNKSMDEFDSLGKSVAEKLPVSGMVKSLSIATQTDFSFSTSPVYLPPDSSMENDDLMKCY